MSNPAIKSCPLKTTSAYMVRVSYEQLEKICDDNSDSGYTNIHGGDIIIDLGYIEERRAEFAEAIGISLEDLPVDGYVVVHI